MANKPMKTLTIGETTYEIVDEQARNDIETLKQNPVIETDNTLTQSGKAADAKVVGDALSEKQPIGDYALKNEIPTVPTKTSELKNDSGYITSVPVTSVNGKTGDVILEVADEIYVGDGDMPEDATIQILLDGSGDEQALKDELKEYIDDSINTKLSQIPNASGVNF